VLVELGGVVADIYWVYVDLTVGAGLPGMAVFGSLSNSGQRVCLMGRLRSRSTALRS